MKPRPGSSEVYTILAPCALVEAGKHGVKIRMRADNYVTFEGGCDWRVADAHDRLAGGSVSCLVWITWMKHTIRVRGAKTYGDAEHGSFVPLEIERCSTCGDLVPLLAGACPFNPPKRAHHTDEVPFWARIVRSGRVR